MRLKDLVLTSRVLRGVGGPWGVERNVKMAGDGGAADGVRLQRVTEMRADGPPLKWKLNA